MSKQHKFETRFKWTGRHPGRAEIQGKPSLALAPSPEFGGPEDGFWSPQDLLISAVESCFMMTFLFLARESEVQVRSYESRAVGTLEKTREGLAFTAVDIYPTVHVAEGQEALVPGLLHDTEESCLMGKSLKCPVRVRLGRGSHGLVRV